MRWIVLVAILLTATPARAESDAMFAARREMVTALAKRDVAAIKARAHLPLQVYGLWFDTDACKKFVGHDLIDVAGDQLAELVGCFADLGVQMLDNRAFISATYGPGAKLLVLMDEDGKQLHGFFGDTTHDGMPVVHPEVFAKHVEKFQRQIVPDAATKKLLDKSRDAFLEGKLILCTSAAGKPDGTLAEDASLRIPTPDAGTPPDFTTVPGYTATVKKAVARWKIKPFIAHGKPVPVCVEMPVGYPESRIAPLAPEWPPPPPGTPQLYPPSLPSLPPPPRPPARPASSDAPQIVSPTILESTRISGEKLIVPDEETKKDIQRSGNAKVIGAWKICLDRSGNVVAVSKLKSTGFEAYDRKIEEKIWRWLYRPFVVDGKPVKVCTSVTFIYSQEAAPPPKR